MEIIKKKYIVDDNNNKVAVQIDIATFAKIEEILENYGLVQLIKENEGEKVMDRDQAKTYYSKQRKAD